MKPLHPQVVKPAAAGDGVAMAEMDADDDVVYNKVVSGDTDASCNSNVAAQQACAATTCVSGEHWRARGGCAMLLCVCWYCWWQCNNTPAAARRRNLPVIAYEAVEVGMAAAVDKELHLPQHVKDFNIETFLRSLGYKMETKAGADDIALPPGAAAPAQAAGRRLQLALPLRRQ